jgi:hypothetical protein
MPREGMTQNWGAIGIGIAPGIVLLEEAAGHTLTVGKAMPREGSRTSGCWGRCIGKVLEHHGPGLDRPTGGRVASKRSSSTAEGQFAPGDSPLLSVFQFSGKGKTYSPERGNLGSWSESFIHNKLWVSQHPL